MRGDVSLAPKNGRHLRGKTGREAKVGEQHAQSRLRRRDRRNENCENFRRENDEDNEGNNS
jgi:hypothetical protein